MAPVMTLPAMGVSRPGGSLDCLCRRTAIEGEPFNFGWAPQFLRGTGDSFNGSSPVTGQIKFRLPRLRREGRVSGLHSFQAILHRYNGIEGCVASRGGLQKTPDQLDPVCGRLFGGLQQNLRTTGGRPAGQALYLGFDSGEFLSVGDRALFKSYSGRERHKSDNPTDPLERMGVLPHQLQIPQNRSQCIVIFAKLLDDILDAVLELPQMPVLIARLVNIPRSLWGLGHSRKGYKAVRTFALRPIRIPKHREHQPVSSAGDGTILCSCSAHCISLVRSQMPQQTPAPSAPHVRVDGGRSNTVEEGALFRSASSTVADMWEGANGRRLRGTCRARLRTPRLKRWIKDVWKKSVQKRNSRPWAAGQKAKSMCAGGGEAAGGRTQNPCLKRAMLYH